MPLKHMTETVLVAVLAVAILLAGFVVGLLPPLSVSIVPWLVAFAFSVAYPLALYPLLRSRRADYPFRALHFAPAFILLSWLAADILTGFLPFAAFFRALLTWGWALAAVALALALLGWFCLNVVRQRLSRLGILAAAFVPFLFFAFYSESSDLRPRLAAAVWPALGLDGYGSQIAQEPADGRNTSSSQHPDEERWRAQMRRMDRRNARLQEREGESPLQASSSSVQVLIGRASSSSSQGWVLGSSQSSVMVAQGTSSEAPWWKFWAGERPSSASSLSSAASSASSTSSVIIAAKPPPHLSSSGPGEVGGLLLAFAAGYCGVLHHRAVRRRNIG